MKLIIFRNKYMLTKCYVNIIYLANVTGFDDCTIVDGIWRKDIEMNPSF